MAMAVTDIPIEQDMKKSYMDYAMSVIVSRALPDARDGLKPVHRRILYSMHELGNTHSKPYKKSARIVGEVLGKYHPHGDAAIYDSLVRMAQPFSLRSVLVDGQGNFGSVDGDSAAAMRYTEVRMKAIAEELLKDIEKETVNFVPNFDGTLKEPTVLPSRIPNLLVNGSAGIAVGMATNVPPHNLGEVSDAIVAAIDGADEEKLLAIVPGPDFPTGGYIVGRSGILSAYKTGRGIIRIRGKAEVKEKEIIVTEIPYQVNKTALIQQIVSRVKEKKIDGISGLHDHSDKEGMSIKIDLKRGEDPEIVLRQLYAHTDLEKSFGIINLALVEGKPKLLTLNDMLWEFINFRKQIITKRSQFELRKAKDRLHILEGLAVALQNIDAIVGMLKAANNADEAKGALGKVYGLSEKQAGAILDMKLQKLTNMEREGIVREKKEKEGEIRILESLLADEKKILEVVKREAQEAKARFADERRTEILDVEEDLGDMEALIPDEKVVVTFSKRGYIKRVPLEQYRTQKRGGLGVIGAETVEEDFIEDLIVTTNHRYLLFFTDAGRVHWLKTYQIPEGGRYSKGKPIVNLLELKEEKVSAWISVQEFSENLHLMMATRNGSIMKTKLSAFSRPRKGGINAITLREGDSLIEVRKTDGSQSLMLGTKNGLAIRFDEKDVRETGRGSMGVRGIRLRKGDGVVGFAVCSKPHILTITENGYGKRTRLEEYRLQGRGGQGIINIKTGGRNGSVVGVKSASDGDELIVVSSSGRIVRMGASDISVIGRNTMGVRIAKLKESEKVSSFTVMKPEEKAAEEQAEEVPEPESKGPAAPPSPPE
ncbi:DNA gyrase subunit A [Candidatus Micrarchaeota archaeon]|nr:DNA gyrase subunit A [Candidatus Micrarchaeota archaeon]MBD3417842.1 DNA gyrase subunit A [Candidatus Micrarchaeota archaeon]